MTTEDLSGTTWLGPRGSTRTVISRDVAYLGNVWMVRIEGYSVLVPYRAEDIRSWTRVDEKAEPAEDAEPAVPEIIQQALRAQAERDPAVPEPILPSVVHDGDLLTGTLYGNPFTDWPVSRIGEGIRWTKGPQYLTNEADAAVTIWRKEVTVTARKPAPSPPMPWMLPGAAPLWMHKVWREFVWLSSMGTADDPGEWVGGYFIPTELMEKLRTAGYNLADLVSAVAAILDAAEES